MFFECLKEDISQKIIFILNIQPSKEVWKNMLKV